jgi:hypothetical protein
MTTKQHITIAALLLCVIGVGHAQSVAGEGKEVIIQPQPALATGDTWQFAITPYFWLPSVDLNLSLPTVNIRNRSFGGDMSTSIPWWESISKIAQGKLLAIDVGGRFEFSKGRWGGFVDGYWMYARATGSSDASRFVLRDRVQVGGAVSVTSKTSLGQLNFGPRYLLGTVPLSGTANGPAVAFETYGGGRVNWINSNVDGTATLTAEALRRSRSRQVDFNSSAGRAYIEPMIGLRTTWTLCKNFVAMIRGDVGGFGLVADENWDCDLEAGIAWQFHKNTYLDLAYRARGQWQNLGSPHDIAVSGWLHGPELGVTFKF